MQDWLNNKRRSQSGDTSITGGLIVQQDTKITQLKSNLDSLQPVLPQEHDYQTQMCYVNNNICYLLYDTLTGNPIINEMIPFFNFDTYNTILWAIESDSNNLNAIHVTKESLDTKYYQTQVLYKETAARFANKTYTEIETITYDTLKWNLSIFSLELNTIIEYPTDSNVLHTLDGQQSIDPSQLIELPTLVWKRDIKGNNHTVVLVVNGSNYDPKWVPKINYWFKHHYKGNKNIKQKLVWDIKEIIDFYDKYGGNIIKRTYKKSLPYLKVGGAVAALAGAGLVLGFKGIPLAIKGAKAVHDGYKYLMSTPEKSDAKNDETKSDETKSEEQETVTNTENSPTTGGFYADTDLLEEEKILAEEIRSLEKTGITSGFFDTVLGQMISNGAKQGYDFVKSGALKDLDKASRNGKSLLGNFTSVAGKLFNYVTKLPDTIQNWIKNPTKVDEWYDNIDVPLSNEDKNPNSSKYIHHIKTFNDFCKLYTPLNMDKWLGNFIEQVQVHIDGTCDIVRLLEHGYTYDQIRKLLLIPWPNAYFYNEFFNYVFCYSMIWCIYGEGIVRYTRETVEDLWKNYGQRIQQLREQYKRYDKKSFASKIKSLFSSGVIIEGPPDESHFKEIDKKVAEAEPRHQIRDYLTSKGLEYGGKLLKLGEETANDAIDVLKNYKERYKQQINTTNLLAQSDAKAKRYSGYVSNWGKVGKAAIKETGETLTELGKQSNNVLQEAAKVKGNLSGLGIPRPSIRVNQETQYSQTPIVRYASTNTGTETQQDSLQKQLASFKEVLEEFQRNILNQQQNNNVQYVDEEVYSEPEV